MYSVIYQTSGTIYQLGPFQTEDEANTAARKAQDEREFSIYDQRVYLLYPDHRMVEYSMSELTGTTT